MEDIFDDISYLLLVAKKRLHATAIVRALLIEAELRERQEILEQTDLQELLFTTKGAEALISYDIVGGRLRVSSGEAMQAVKILLQQGDKNNARILYSLAEPLDLLSGSAGVGRPFEEEYKVLKSWVDISHNFLSVSYLSV